MKKMSPRVRTMAKQMGLSKGSMKAKGLAKMPTKAMGKMKMAKRSY